MIVSAFSLFLSYVQQNKVDLFFSNSKYSSSIYKYCLNSSLWNYLRQSVRWILTISPAFKYCLLFHCWLGGTKGIQSVKNSVVGCWHGYLPGYLHITHLIPMPLTVSCFSKIHSRLVLSFWYRLTQVVLDKGPLNGCVFNSNSSASFIQT